MLEDPERHVASFGRNKTRNANQNFLTRCINQEIVVTQRIQHVGMWHMFKIGRIPGTNFIINTEFVKVLVGGEMAPMTEDTDISFKIMQSGKLIALAYNSEASNKNQRQLKAIICSGNVGLKEIMRLLFQISSICLTRGIGT